MEFKEEKITSFQSNFESVKNKIRNFPGCSFLELWQDVNDPTIFFTHSHWESVTDLENYRESELFRGVWATTKVMFRSKAEAWSVNSHGPVT